MEMDGWPPRKANVDVNVNDVNPLPQPTPNVVLWSVMGRAGLFHVISPHLHRLSFTFHLHPAGAYQRCNDLRRPRCYLMRSSKYGTCTHRMPDLPRTTTQM